MPPPARTAPADALADPHRVRAMRRALARWYERHARDLPWRRTRDPYRILLSEFLLQQTRVESAIGYYERFLAAFPTACALAAADVDDVLRCWSGLGYYRRARHLHAAAGAIVREWGGRVPTTVAGLRNLPGVGPYTAAAVASIACGVSAAAVDGNVKRVVARLLGHAGAVDERATQSVLWTAAERLLAPRNPGRHNQAMMELGATVCLPRRPRCTVCPLRRWCRGHKRGDPQALGAPRRRGAVPSERFCAAALVDGGRVLLVRRPDAGLLGGMWTLPHVAAGTGRPDAALRTHLTTRFGLDCRIASHCGQVRHVFTHRRWELDVYRCTRAGGRLRREADARWLLLSAPTTLPLARLDRKLLAAAGVELG